MRFPPRTLEGIANASIDCAFRRWERPRVEAGGRQLTAIGVIGFDSVETVAREAVTDVEAARAGFESAAQLIGFLDRREAGDIHRVMLRVVGPDPRVALRDAVPDAAEIDHLCRRLDRLDRASSHGPWTRDVLELIAANPERRAGELAAEVGRERLAFKVDVRKLKQLGLTESLPIGYRISPRGRAVLERLREGVRPA
ncbi:MAG TPA: hypothetical protein VFH98_06080 [Candidatus Limnocylindria bacterium]|nr:hypothetical protein [Candidatus Limnocylindria bacterium]